MAHTAALEGAVLALQKSGEDLANLAVYCAQNYKGAATPQARAEAVAATKKYAADALASVAYQLYTASGAVNDGAAVAGRAVTNAGREVHAVGEVLDAVIESGGDITPATIPSDAPAPLFTPRPPAIARMGREPAQPNPVRTPLRLEALDRIGTDASAMDGIARSRLAARVVGGDGMATTTAHSALGLVVPRPAGSAAPASPGVRRNTATAAHGLAFIAAPPPRIAPVAPVAPRAPPATQATPAPDSDMPPPSGSAGMAHAPVQTTAGRVLYDYVADGSDTVSLRAGVRVDILSESGDWVLVVAEGGTQGWFPRAYVE